MLWLFFASPPAAARAPGCRRAAEADAIMSVSICEFPVEAEFPTNLEKKPRAHFSLILFQDT